MTATDTYNKWLNFSKTLYTGQQKQFAKLVRSNLGYIRCAKSENEVNFIRLALVFEIIYNLRRFFFSKINIFATRGHCVTIKLC